MKREDYWPTITETTIREHGKQVSKTTTYSHTPEEFVAALRKHDAHIYVAKRCCTECFYVPESPFPQASLRQAEHDELVQHPRILQCLRSCVRDFQSPFTKPDFIACYGFYYQYWHENMYLLAAKEAGLIVFCDVSEMVSLKESGLLITAPGFFLD